MTRSSGPIRPGLARRRALPAAFLLAVAGGSAPGAAAESRADASPVACEQPDGILRAVAAAHAPDGARCHPLGLDGTAGVRWVGWLGGPERAMRRIVVDGVVQDGAFMARAARRLPASGPDPKPWLPLAEPLLAHVEARAFGVEERVALRQDGAGLAIECRPGGKPAGIALDLASRRLPPGAPLAWTWSALGGADFSVGAAPSGASPPSLAPLGASGALPLSADASALVIACPPAGGQATLTDLRVERRPAATLPGPVPRSAWAWRPERWREPSALLDALRAARAGRAFITVDLDGEGAVADPRRLAAFVTAAREAGVAVVAVEGDPGMATPAGRDAALRRLGALAAYQRAAAPAARLAGVQYDIEPYLLPAYAEAPETVLRGWAESIEAIAAAVPAELDMVVPFWLAEDPLAGPIVLPSLARASGRVTVMAYRTSAAAVQAAAIPFLAWGERTGVPIVVALEAGPVEDEAARIYAATPADGPLHLVAAPDGRTLAILLDEPRAGAPGTVFAFERQSLAPGSRVSFLGDVDRLERTVAALEPALRSWSSFAGIALHGVVD